MKVIIRDACSIYNSLAECSCKKAKRSQTLTSNFLIKVNYNFPPSSADVKKHTISLLNGFYAVGYGQTLYSLCLIISLKQVKILRGYLIFNKIEGRPYYLSGAYPPPPYFF